MKRFLAILTVLAVVLVAFAACGGGQGETPSGATAMTMGTGGTQGTYYAYGGILGNQIKSATGITTNVVSTDGSKANILGIDLGTYQLGTVQSDVMAYAVAGSRTFEAEGAIDTFRVIGGLYAEAVQLITMDPEIKSVADLKGRTVSIGAPGSGVYFNAVDVLAAAGLTEDDIKAQYQSFGDSADALKDGKIDAFFCTAGAPTVAITDLATTTGIVLVEIDAEHLAALQKDYGFYAEYKVPAGTYKGIDSEVSTVAVKATFIVSNDLDEETVYQLTKAMYENAGEYAHEKASEMTIEYAVSSISVPFHPGAERYYKEVGAIS